jgi:hypothetical protein
MRSAQTCLALLLLLLPVAAHPGPATEIVIHGQIRADGRPLARARVELFSLETAYERGRKRLGDPAPAARAGALTGADGQFQIAAPESGMWRLVASAPGYVPMELPLFPLTDEMDLPVVELPRDTGRQVRVLTDKGAPVVSARVLTAPARILDAYSPWIPTWEPAEQLGLTDANGSVTLLGSGESVLVEVWAQGYPTAVLSGTRRLEVRLSQGSEQRILVRDARGRPSGGVQARIESEEVPAAVSDPQGRLSLMLPAGRKSAVRFLGNTGERTEIDLAPRPGPAPKALTVDLRAPEILAGRILSLSSRTPVPGALVWMGRDFSTFVRTDRTGGYALALGSPGPIRATATGYFEDTFQGPLTAPGPSFALRPKTFLPGSVVDERGRPVAGVEIRARYDATAIRWADITIRFSGGLTRSRDTGMFRVDRLVPGADYKLRFAKDGFAPRLVQVKAPEPDVPPEPLRIVLSAGLKAGGFIRDRQDKPLPGAVVELQPSIPSDAVARLRVVRDPDPALSRKAATDANGRFDLLNVAPGTFDLSVRAAGFAAARVPGIEIPEGPGPVDLGTVVLEGEAVVSGLVRSSDGRPLEGAAIHVVPSESPPGGPAGVPDAVSDTEGRFEIHGNRLGARLKLSAERSGYAPAQVSGVTAPTETPVVLTLSPRGRISGRVVDSDSRPVADTMLQALSVKTEVFGGMAIQGGDVVEARSHEDGTFVIEGVEPGPVELTASAPEWQDSSRQLQVPVGKDLEGIELVLHKAALLQGQVLGPDGNSVARAEIGRYLPPRPGEIRYEAPLAFSDAEGRYRIGALAPGRLSLAARHGTFGDAVRDIDLQSGDNTLDFELTGGQTVSGRVVDPSGSPAAEARVSLRSNSWAAGPPDVMSEPDGSFHFKGISPGTYHLEARKEGAGRSRQPVPVTVAEAPLDGVVLELTPTGTIHGRILGLNVDELAQVQVSAGWGAGISTVIYDGSYRITDLAPGDWRVVAEIPRTGRRTEGEVTLEPEADAELDLDFEGGLTLRGSVRKDGRALAGATITLNGGTMPSSTETGPEGRFELRGLIAGLYRLEVSDYRTGVLTARQIQLQQDQDIVIDIESTSLGGVVLDARDRQPLGYVELTLSSLEGGEEGVIDRRAVSSAGGAFSFADVAEGTWKLTANRPGYVSKEQVLSLGSTPQHIEILLDPAPGLSQVVSPP